MILNESDSRPLRDILNEYEYHIQLASPASPASQPSQPVCTVVRHFAEPSNQSSQMLGIYYWIAICFPKEIDAFLFSGPEQFFNGAPMISPLADRIDFSMQNRWIWTDPPLAVVKTDQNLLLGCSMST